MPTKTGLPQIGEVWRMTHVLPKNDGSGKWETTAHDFVVIQRGTGAYWSLTGRDLETNREFRDVDASYFFSKGQLTFVRSQQ